MGEARASCLSATWRVCNALMCFFFALASYVQINDPDAAVWMVGYGVPAVLCACVALNPHVTESLPWRRVADLHLLVSSVVVSSLVWRLRDRTTDILQQEEGRECSGLLLTAVWLLLCRRSGSAPVGRLRVSSAVAVAAFPFAAWLYFHVNTALTADWPSHCQTAL